MQNENISIASEFCWWEFVEVEHEKFAKNCKRVDERNFFSDSFLVV
jgi:hypothetical protein